MKLGPRVLGEEQFAQQQQADEQARKQGYLYGTRVTGEGEVPAAAPPSGEGSKPAPAHVLSVKELEKALKGNPSEKLLDELIEAELNRPEGRPRKSALRLLVGAEESRGEQARAPVLAELQGKIEAE